MLFFITVGFAAICVACWFQYIQCYFLSDLVVNIRPTAAYFNTSNVIFYPLAESKKSTRNSFQYIQCYFLSLLSDNCHPLPRLFQYIQCYFLSVHAEHFREESRNFNTSNVIFYPREIIRHYLRRKKFQYIQCYFLSWKSWSPWKSLWNFNTSNVIFYQVLVLRKA